MRVELNLAMFASAMLTGMPDISGCFASICPHSNQDSDKNLYLVRANWSPRSRVKGMHFIGIIIGIFY